jgi:hypothetical protein
MSTPAATAAAQPHSSTGIPAPNDLTSVGPDVAGAITYSTGKASVAAARNPAHSGRVDRITPVLAPARFGGGAPTGGHRW